LKYEFIIVTTEKQVQRSSRKDSDQMTSLLQAKLLSISYQDNFQSNHLEHPYVDGLDSDTRTGLVPTMQEIIENAVNV
jgi:hypothetical protein